MVNSTGCGETSDHGEEHNTDLDVLRREREREDRELEELIRQREARQRENRNLEDRIRRRTGDLTRERERNASPLPRPLPGARRSRSRSRQRRGRSEACSQHLIPFNDPEDADVAADPDAAAADDEPIGRVFYAKLFKTLRETKSDKWSIK